MSLFTHPSLTLDDSSPGIMELGAFFSVRPHYRYFSADLREKIEGMKKKDGNRQDLREIIETLEEVRDNIDKAIPEWELIERLKAKIETRFKANKVSETFPLYFIPLGAVNPHLFFVSLKEEIETPEYVHKFLELIKAGCKASGMKEVPEKMRREVMIGQKDKFGKTLEIEGIEHLLSQLSPPKTIISDIYMVDRFPELQEADLETHEFRL